MFLKFINKLEKKLPVIICGDLNVAHQEIDLARPKENTKNPGFTQEERYGFQNILDSGFIDTFRNLKRKEVTILGGVIEQITDKEMLMEN